MINSCCFKYSENTRSICLSIPVRVVRRSRELSEGKEASPLHDLVLRAGDRSHHPRRTYYWSSADPRLPKVLHRLELLHGVIVRRASVSGKPSFLENLHFRETSVSAIWWVKVHLNYAFMGLHLNTWTFAIILVENLENSVLKPRKLLQNSWKNILLLSWTAFFSGS